MKESFVRAFALSESPFSKEIEDSDLWLPPSKETIVDELCEAAHSHEQVVLVGEPGVGKTCVLRAYRHRLPQGGFRLTYCHNTTLGRRDFYRQVCAALGLSPAATAARVFYSITTHVQELGRERVHPVLVIDEAHLLHQDTLDHLHILLNYEWDKSPLLSLVLVGLPELQDRLELRKNRSLYSRIHRRLSIGPLSVDDTADYIRMRLRRVGCDRELFATDALSALHHAAGTSLRDIDRIATAALRKAACQKKRLVDRDALAQVLDGNAMPAS
jgi:type II secretory pathway predicted ATPase ExeA